MDSVSKVLSIDAKKVILVTPDDFRAMEAEDLERLLKAQCRVEKAASFNDAAVKALNEYEEGDVILSAGSLYTIGDMKNAFQMALAALSK